MTSNKRLFQKLMTKVRPINKDQTMDDVYMSLLEGKNRYLRMSRYESSLFDTSWIKVIEDVLYDLGEIVNNPRQVTKVESNVVPVELAKKVNGESVQHLASHTQYIKQIDEHGDVVPSKILSHSNEDDLHTYENRFIATFIRRLVLFVEKRYIFIREKIPLHIEDVLFMKNTSVVDGKEVEIETKIKVKRESDDDVAIKSKDYTERIMKMREYIFYYYNSPFMHKLKNEKDVRRPILQTNIIRKNPKYHHCYETFLFIERFESLGVNYKVEESYKTFNDEERAELNYLFLSSYLAIQDDREFDEIKRNQKVYKPRMMTTIDDEKFIYGPYVNGPIQFVRVDEEYRHYLESKVKNDLPLHPDRYEKLYYEDDYITKRKTKENLKEKERLEKRLEREAAQYEKEVQKIISKREAEEAEEQRLRLQEIADEEESLIQAKRREIIAAAYDEEELLRIAKEKFEAERREREVQLEESLSEATNNEDIVQEEITSFAPEVIEEPVQEEPVAEETPIEEEKAEEPIQEEPQEETEPEEQPVEETPKEQPIEEEKPQEEVQEEAPQEEVVPKEQKEEEPQEETAPEEEQPAEEQQEEVPEEPIEEVKEETPEEIIPEEEPAEEEKTEEEIAPEESVEEATPEEAPAEEVPAEEAQEAQPEAEQPQEEPQPEEKPKKKRKRRKKRKKKAKPVEPAEEPVSNETEESAPSEPVEEAMPEEAPIEEEPQEEIPEVEETPVEEPIEEQPIEEAPQEEPVPEEVPQEEAIPEESAPEPEAPAEPIKKKKAAPKKKPAKKAKKKEEKREVIPGKFVVKTPMGYYVKKNKYSVYKSEATVLNDFNEAHDLKEKYGGKVVKL